MSLFDAAPTPSASRVSTPRDRPADEPPLSREAEPEAEPLATPADAAEYRAALAAFRTGAWPQERWTTFRLRHGVYAQAQADTYMVRAKLPGGRLSFDQARADGRAAPVVLLSPACASFDQFTDFEARGDAFRDLVREVAA